MTPKEGLDSLELQLSFQREAARLVHGIDRLFPAKKKTKWTREVKLSCSNRKWPQNHLEGSAVSQFETPRH